jgi:hypothetical protein
MKKGGLKTIIFRTIKNTKIEIDLEDRNYTIKEIKNLIKDQYGFDSNKLKISNNKYDKNCLDDNDKINATQYIKNKNTYYIRNYKYIPIKIYDDEKDDSDDKDIDIDLFVQYNFDSFSNPNIQDFKYSEDEKQNKNNEENKKDDESSTKSNNKNVNNTPNKNDKNVNNTPNKNDKNVNNTPNKNDKNVNHINNKVNGENKYPLKQMNSAIIQNPIIPEEPEEIKKVPSFEISEEFKNKIKQMQEVLECSQEEASKALSNTKGNFVEAINFLKSSGFKISSEYNNKIKKMEDSLECTLEEAYRGLRKTNGNVTEAIKFLKSSNYELNEKYKDKIKQIHEVLGLSKDKELKALIKFKGNVDQAINFLLGDE